MNRLLELHKESNYAQLTRDPLGFVYQIILSGSKPTISLFFGLLLFFVQRSAKMKLASISAPSRRILRIYTDPSLQYCLGLDPWSSCYVVQFNSVKILLDCGFELKTSLPHFLPYYLNPTKHDLSNLNASSISKPGNSNPSPSGAGTGTSSQFASTLDSSGVFKQPFARSTDTHKQGTIH